MFAFRSLLVVEDRAEENPEHLEGDQEETNKLATKTGVDDEKAT